MGDFADSWDALKGAIVREKMAKTVGDQQRARNDAQTAFNGLAADIVDDADKDALSELEHTHRL